jgi:hypothetical protein
MIGKTSYGVIILILLFLIGCSDSLVTPQKEGSDYKFFYPVEIGRSYIYDVSFIEIDAPSGFYDTSYYQLKVNFDSYFIDNLGDSAVKIERYFQNDESPNWTVLDVWYANLYIDELHIVEENNRYVKLKNPIKIGNEWDGNKYNITDTLNLFNYSIISINDMSIEGVIYDSVLTVLQRNDSSLIDKILYQEMYAKDLGLVYKEITNINSQNPNINIPIEERITTGTIYKMSLISYSDEN